MLLPSGCGAGVAEYADGVVVATSAGATTNRIILKMCFTVNLPKRKLPGEDIESQIVRKVALENSAKRPGCELAPPAGFKVWTKARPRRQTAAS